VVNGDTVIVRPGTYVENLDFLGKEIVLQSESWPQITVIDGGQVASVVRFMSGEGVGAVIDGFTLFNGDGDDYGGGIDCWDNSCPTIVNNIITGNTADNGGGIACVSGAAPVISNNEITGNSAPEAGGGIYCWSADPQILENTIRENTGGHGGGIYCWFSSHPTITGNRITGNATGSKHYSGGGICCYYQSSPLIVNNQITGNTSDLHGGGIYCDQEASPEILNNTIVSNSADSYGGGIHCENDSQPECCNTILWDNTASDGPQISVMGIPFFPSKLTISYSDVKGGIGSVYVESPSSLDWGPGMINLTPLFVEAFKDDYHLRYHSPCRNTGYTEAVTTAHDFEGDPRIVYTTVDMGADEFHPRMYIMGDKTPGGQVWLRFLGLPDSSVLFFIGHEVWEVPLNWWPYGLWYLKPPIYGPFLMGTSLGPYGLNLLGTAIPLYPPGPYTLYFHGLIRSESTNLEKLDVF
jgi:parallel beta-helix repeat protein